MTDKYTAEQKLRNLAQVIRTHGTIPPVSLEMIADELSQAGQMMRDPIPMILFCPTCGMQHIDAPETDATVYSDGHESSWDNPPHRSHLCHACGCIWRPADVPTTGIAKIETRGKADTFDAEKVRNEGERT